MDSYKLFITLIISWCYYLSVIVCFGSRDNELKVWTGTTWETCNCNGKSNRCYFDNDLWRTTGRGGHCIDCIDNTSGPNCERCKENHYLSQDNQCVSCNCDPTGSISLQCVGEGKCYCKPGIEGQKCDNRPMCGCNIAGSWNNTASCDRANGVCRCKQNVDGKYCDKCKHGFFDLQSDNEFGCLPCYCFGHSSECTSAPGFFMHTIESSFNRDAEQWSAKDRNARNIPHHYNSVGKYVSVNSVTREPVYFIAPEKYLGDQRAAYNQFLSFSLRIGDEDPRATVEDIVLEGQQLVIYQPIFGQGNPLPSTRSHEFKFRLHEDARYGWAPRLSAKEFISVLSNVTALKIRATYTPSGSGFIDDIRLESAQKMPYNERATWIEMCSCPNGYVGQFCESCSPGFRRISPAAGSETKCVAESCDPETGYQCDSCVSGKYGSGSCPKCDCNGNINVDDFGNCNATTGECIKCIYNTHGSQCEKCLPGYYGDALALPKDDCKPCNCHPYGTNQHSLQTSPIASFSYITSFQSSSLLCNSITGQCNCKTNVDGRQCNTCLDGYWGLTSNEGCKPCACDSIGSENRTCDDSTAQCYCKPGITGKQCNQCLPLHYGYSPKGCLKCECDSIGSTSPKCDERGGQCECRQNIEGRRCERCRENMYNMEAGCIECHPCYGLVQEAVNSHRARLSEITSLINDIIINPTFEVDINFERQLQEVLNKVNRLLDDARRAQGSDASLISQLENMRERILRVQETLARIAEESELIGTSANYGEQNITIAEQMIDRAQDTLNQARRYLDVDGLNALEKALQRSYKFGQQSKRMSDIAREARTLADKHENEAKAIEDFSNEASNISDTAYKMAKEAIDTQEANRKEINRLRSKLEDTNDLLIRTEKMSEEANKEAGKANSDALSLYTEINAIIVPKLESDKYKHEAIDIIEQAKRILREANDLLARYGDTINGTGYQLIDARDLLEEAMRQQRITDELLANTDAALQRAKQAIAGGEKILEDAKNTLKTLQQFDKLVKDSKAKANDALKKVPEIERMIIEAEDKTGDAENALGGALTDAIEARDIAREAQRIAEKASVDADKIRGEATFTKTRATRIKGDAKDLVVEVDATSRRMKGYEEQANTDEMSAKDALEKVNQAKTSAQDATRKVIKSTKIVEGILDSLGDLDNVDLTLLEDLERRLARAEQELKDADLDNRIGELGNTREEQNRWMKNYDEEIEKLKRDVANIGDIRESLPDGCFRRHKLEP